MAAKKDATKVVAETLAQGQAQYFELAEKAQNAALAAYKTYFEQMSNLGMTELPGLKAALDMRADLVEGAFDFGAAVLDNQRKFATELLSVSTTKA